MSDDQPDRTDGLSREYEPPSLSVYESETPSQWAALREGEHAPNDLLKATAAAEASPDASPEVLQWSAPQPEYDYPDPEVFVAPVGAARKVSGPKEVPRKTTASGKTTRAHATKTKLTGRDAFGGTICTCNLVCTCNQVCTCEAVATCSCVAYSAGGGGGGGGGGACTCNAVCTCQGVSSCTCQAEPY